MSSIIEGYNYDIFISYRQKDNKGDRWVSEFVEALKTELESTFKEEISVYFDINPHDGLLETHDVDASLKDKLKCLVFIPIISRTYCDPKSFAWEHEFKAFIQQASQDQFGLKVKLFGGNVANRVLPVQIHELDADDKKLIENELGGFIRGIEFIYKEQGVDRPLKPKDNEERNLKNTNYPNQINKIALALKNIFLGLRTEVTVPVKEMTNQNVSIETRKNNERKSHNLRSLRIKSLIFRKFAALSLVGLLGIVIIGILIFWHKNSSKPSSVQRFIHHLPQHETIGGMNLGSSIVISPDGVKLIFVSNRNDTSYLFLRMIDDFEAKLIFGTEGAAAPFFSPDSRWVAFFSDGKLKKVSILGGAPQSICEARSGYEGCWGNDNFIIYSDFYKGCLMRVPSIGGIPQQLTTALKLAVGEGEHSHLWPQILPDGNILFTIWHNNEDMRIVVYSPEIGKRWNIIGPGSHARYLRTGHIIYAWKGDLLVVPFNIKKMEVSGQPIVLLKGVLMNALGLAHFSISNDGSLAYIPGIFTNPNIHLHWLIIMELLNH